MKYHLFARLPTDQKRWASSYIAEACVLRRGILDEDVCGLNDTAPQLDIPIVPCNFVPVQPNYYSGKFYNASRQVSNRLNVLLSSAR